MNHRRSPTGKIVAILVLALLGYGLIQFGPVYYRAWRFELAMDKALRNDYTPDQAFLIDTLIRKAEALGLPPLTGENFQCDCAPGTEGVLQCSYTEIVHFPPGRVVTLKQEIEVHAPIPTEPDKTE